MDRGPLGDEIDRFIDSVCNDLADLSRQPASMHRHDVILEVGNIVAAALAADGRLSDDEAWAYVSGIGTISEPSVIGTPAELRANGMWDNAASWSAKPSVLFDLLVSADARDGTNRNERYQELALRLCRAAMAIDLVTTQAELDHIETFRRTMLAAVDAAEVPRIGAPARPTSPTSPTSPTVSTTDPQQPVRATKGPAVIDAGQAAGEAKAAASTSPVTPPPARTIAELMAELDALIGLQSVKDEVARLTSLLQIQALRAERGLPTIEVSHHLVFTGNPGTGKTTVARLLSQIYKAVGVVSKGQLIETDRSSLVAGFVGQTATKTMAVLQSSLGGMLLIDEAYSLARGGKDDFGLEAIDTLVKFMEDHRDDIGIVAAGYPAEMQDFIDTNPGLKSRFTRTIDFADYTDEELVTIFESLCDKNRYSPTDDAIAKLQLLLAAQPRDRGFGNARFIRNVFEDAVALQAQRLTVLEEPTNEQLCTLVTDDLPAVGVRQ